MWVMLVLAVTLAGCGAPVLLLTGTGGLHATVGMTACYTSFATGQLVPDPAYGTAIIETDRPVPVMWPDGYTGRQSGSEVEVLDKSGHVVARTGTVVRLEGGYWGESPRAFVACGYVL